MPPGIFEMDYLDSNIFIYLLTDNRSFGKASKDYLRSVAAGETKGCSSVYSLSEVYFALARWFKWPPGELKIALETLMQMSGVRFLPLGEEVMLQLPQLLERGMKFGDAIHLATMRFNSLTDIVTFDKDFENLSGITKKLPK